jgi:glycerol-3-phosphate acyltransferase PlsX
VAQPVRIAVDVASGDFGTGEMVRGVLEAQRVWGDAFAPVLCGDRGAIERTLAEAGVKWPVDGMRIEHCPDTLQPSDVPSRAWKRRQRAAIVRCIALQREGAVDATVSAGDTGVLLAGAVFILGRLSGVSRPALAATLPTMAGRPALLLDVGANVDCRAGHLLSFARLGCEYIGRSAGVAAPRVALLNVGAERSKGTRLIAEAHRLIQRECGGYCGYIEAGRVFSGDADVIVCDGFAGNVLLKVCQGFYAITETLLAGSPQILETVKSRMAILNSESYGAVPLLGIRGVVLKAHGNSSARAVASAVGTTLAAAHRGVVTLDGAGGMKGHRHAHER